MYGEERKIRAMIVIMILMAAYFIGIGIFNKLDKKNDNNTYISLNVETLSKEEYIKEYIVLVQEKKYDMAYNMLDDSSKNAFNNSLNKYKEYAEYMYKDIKKGMWKFVYNEVSNESFRNYNTYKYTVIDGEDKQTVVIPIIAVYEYAANVFKIGIEEVK